MEIKRAYRVKELADLYGVDVRSFKAWLTPIMPGLEEIGFDVSKRIHTAKQCQMIVDFLGEP
jgi:hypothetical protein